MLSSPNECFMGLFYSFPYNLKKPKKKGNVFKGECVDKLVFWNYKNLQHQ